MLENKPTIKILILIAIISVSINIVIGINSLHDKIRAEGVQEGKTLVSNQIVAEVINTGQLRVNINTEEGLKTILLVPYNAGE